MLKELSKMKETGYQPVWLVDQTINYGRRSIPTWVLYTVMDILGADFIKNLFSEERFGNNNDENHVILNIVYVAAYFLCYRTHVILSKFILATDII